MNYVDKLNTYLANLTVLFTKQHNLHWYVTGEIFFVLHAKIEEFYDETATHIDDVAERILQLNGEPFASLKDALAAATVKEIPAKHVGGKEAMTIIAEDFKIMLEDAKEIIALASEANDEGTADMFVGYTQGYEKSLWLIKQYLM